jgi:hypothetical protein
MEPVRGHEEDPLAAAIRNLRVAVLAIRTDTHAVALEDGAPVEAVVKQLRRTVDALGPNSDLSMALLELAAALEERFELAVA